MSGKLWVGTSGYTYSHWIGKFYPHELPRSKWLEFYAKHFDCVEINYTFYHMPKESTVQKWRDNAPEGFLFILKASKLITHSKNINSATFLLHKFLGLVEILDEHAGPVLMQFPPWFKDIEALGKYLARIKPHHKVAMEFRHEELLGSEKVRQMLTAHNVAFCVADSPKYKPVFVVTADFIYLRFHGSRQWYASSYTNEEFEPFVIFARQNLSEGRDVFAFFNNDALGYAVENALRFRELVLGKS